MDEGLKPKKFCQSCQSYIAFENMVAVKRAWKDRTIANKRTCTVFRCKWCLEAAEKRKREMGIK